MANTRIINSIIWEDEFFTGLQLFDRLLWLGLITSCADDQGRLQDNPALIRSKVFPTDDLHLESIENSLRNIEGQGKVVRYAVNGKRLIQIVNWWKHQNPRWAGKSIYPSPPGWIDRERYHTTGNKIAEKNWSIKGGYLDGYIAPYTINDVNDDVNDDVNVNGDDDVKSSSGNDFNDDVQELLGYIAQITKLPLMFGGIAENVEAAKEMVKAGVIKEDVQAGYDWLCNQNRKITSARSLVRSSIIAMSQRRRGVPVAVAEESTEDRIRRVVTNGY